MNGTFPPLSRVLLAIVSDGAFALIVGLLLAKYWLGVRSTNGTLPEQIRVRFDQLLLAWTSILGLTNVARLWFLTAAMSGLSRWNDIVSMIPQVLNVTHQGRVWFLGSGAILTLFVAALISSRGSRTFTSYAMMLSLLLLGFVKAASGHAADDGDFTLIEIIQTLHILATAVWAGSILISGWLVVSRLGHFLNLERLEKYGNQLSGTAAYAIVVIVLSGVFTADRELDGHLSGLWTSPWGKVLTIKMCFVALALLIGAYNRFVSLRRLKTERKPALFVRGVVAEAVVMTIIICFSGLLGGIAPVSSM